MKPHVLLSFLLAAIFPVALPAQTFTVASLNVDGLPTSILGIPINDDGPGVSGSNLISHFLARKGYDIIGMQEDFENDFELRSQLADDYDCGQWQGSVLDNVTWESLLSLKAKTDGLRLFWRREHRLLTEEAVTWNESYGKLDHAADNLAAKGYRRAEMLLSGGQQIVVYDLHMDASNKLDELSGQDIYDKRARWAQWRQLADAVMARLDQRPVIVMGDMNSYYTRDSILSLFINPIEQTGRYTVNDAWVQTARLGHYPAIGDEPLSTGKHGFEQGETLDKIIYINPVTGPHLILTDYHVATDYTWDDGRPLGDHYPVVARFQFAGDKTSSIDAPSDPSPSTLYDLQGRRLAAPPRQGIYIRQGRKVVKTRP